MNAAKLEQDGAGATAMSWIKATAHLRPWTQSGAILVPNRPPEDDPTRRVTTVSYQYGDNILASKSCADHPGEELLAVPSSWYLIVRTKEGRVQVHQRVTGAFLTLTESQAAAFEVGGLKVSDHFLLIHSRPGSEHLVEIINLAPLCSRPPPSWLIKTVAWSNEKKVRAGGAIVDVDVTASSMVVTRASDITIVVDDGAESNGIRCGPWRTLTPGMLTGRARQQARHDVFLCTLSLTEEDFLAVCYSAGEGILRMMRINAREPLALKKDPLRILPLKTKVNGNAEQVQSTSNGAIIAYESREEGVGVIYTVVWKSIGNKTTTWDAVTQLKKRLIGEPVQLLVDPYSLDRNAVMLTVHGNTLKLFVVRGSSGNIQLVKQADCLPLSFPQAALFVPQCVNPRHIKDGDTQVSAPVVAALLHRLWVVTNLFEAAKSKALDPESDIASRVQKLQESLADMLKGFKALRRKHQEVVSRYETKLVTLEDSVGSRERELALAAAEKAAQRDKTIGKLQSEAARLQNLQKETARAKARLEQQLTEERATAMKLETTIEQLKRRLIEEQRGAAAVDRAGAKRAAELAEARAAHAAELAEARAAHAAELAEAHKRQAAPRAIPTPPPEAQPAPAKLVEALRLENARLLHTCHAKQMLLANYESVYYTGALDPVYMTPLPQLIEQVAHLNQFKQDNAKLYERNEELRRQLAALQEPEE